MHRFFVKQLYIETRKVANCDALPGPDLPSAGPLFKKCGALHLEKTGDLF